MCVDVENLEGRKHEGAGVDETIEEVFDNGPASSSRAEQ